MVAVRQDPALPGAREVVGDCDGVRHRVELLAGPPLECRPRVPESLAVQAVDWDEFQTRRHGE